MVKKEKSKNKEVKIEPKIKVIEQKNPVPESVRKEIFTPSGFQDNILKRVRKFSVHVPQAEKNEKKETLEQTAEKIETPINNPAQPQQTVYSTNTSQASYGINTTNNTGSNPNSNNSDLNSTYRAGAITSNPLEIRNDRTITPLGMSSSSNGINEQNQSSEFDRIQESYKNERHDTNLPFQNTKKRRNDIW